MERVSLWNTYERTRHMHAGIAAQYADDTVRRGVPTETERREPRPRGLVQRRVATVETAGIEWLGWLTRRLDRPSIQEYSCSLVLKSTTLGEVSLWPCMWVCLSNRIDSPLYLRKSSPTPQAVDRALHGSLRNSPPFTRCALSGQARGMASGRQGIFGCIA
jgi:hypothetical protein